MKNDGRFMTRKEQQRAEFEDHFYATWPRVIKDMRLHELDYLNETKLAEVNAAWPETILVLKSWVLHEMAMKEDMMDYGAGI